MERVKRKAVINDKMVESDFMPGDVVRAKEGYSAFNRQEWEGTVIKADALFVYVDWGSEERKDRRGRCWMVDSLEIVKEDSQ